MEFLSSIHSFVRWMVVVAAVVVALKFLIGWLRQGEFSGIDRGLSAAFTGLIDLQALLGLIFLIGDGLSGAGFLRYRLDHGFIMIVAVAVAHLPARWKNAGAKIRFRNSFFVIVAIAVLIFVGVSLLPMNRWAIN